MGQRSLNGVLGRQGIWGGCQGRGAIKALRKHQGLLNVLSVCNSPLQCRSVPLRMPGKGGTKEHQAWLLRVGMVVRTCPLGL